jgi:antitoxin (DNA-binding transcriptional repressor) of toxin-antitoxin stability system
MKRAEVRDLRSRLSEVEPLQEGRKIEITKRRGVIARLLSAPVMSRHRPDFLARARSIYSAGPLKVGGAKMLAEWRDRH